MLCLKSEVYNALNSIDPTNITVTDVYPMDWSKQYQIQYMETDNSVWEKTDKVEQLSHITWTIYAWSNENLTTLASNIDDAMSALGLWRTGCTDTNDPSGRRHKVMRYEGLVDENGTVFWDNNR